MNKLFVFALIALPLAAAYTSTPVDRLLDRIFEREKSFLDSIRQRTPLIETYIQETPDTAPPEAHPNVDARSNVDARPNKDHYFLGRFRMADTIAYEPLVDRTDAPAPAKSKHAPKNPPMSFLPRGFAQMAVMDLHDFNRQTYTLDYVRREFLGEIRCLVFDVAPAHPGQVGKFIGRIWVEDRDDSIVRFNGTYIQPPPTKNTPAERYFHFDSWRVDSGAGEWVPAQIYIEEEPAVGTIDTGTRRFKAQSRIWDYVSARSSKLDELTSILVDSASAVKDDATPKDISPLESQRDWEHQAEENLIERLEKGGLIAPPGPVDDVLNTVVNNLIVSANLNVDAHCRVLMTTPIETFSIGHTIVISRGLIDVLPDEASLALVLADELAHIALGHPTPTQFAFRNQTMLSDADLLQRFRFQRSEDEIASAGVKTIEIMRDSPYKKMANAGLFLKALAARGSELPRLLHANLGNQVANAEALSRLAEFATAAPALDDQKLEQIAALPLGSRVKINPWNNQLTLVKTRPISLLSAREKMPFEVTPFVLYLTRSPK